jgi:hypothetical protein
LGEKFVWQMREFSVSVCRALARRGDSEEEEVN